MAPAFSLSAVQPYVNIQPNPQFAVDLMNALQYQPVRDLFGGLVEQYSSKAVEDMQCKISTMDSEITSLRNEIEELKQYSRRNALRVFNPDWRETDGEDTDNLILDMANDMMNLSLNQRDISRSHRVGKPNAQGTPRPILVKFATYRAREAVMQARSTVRASNIQINEDLTKHISALAFEAREAKRSGRILATHVYDGKVFVKGGSQYRSTTIYNTDDLESYIQNNPTYAQRTNPNTSHQRRGTSASAPQNKRSEHHAPGGRMADIRAAQRESQAGALRTAAERLKTPDASSNTASVPINNLSNQGATPHLPSQSGANLPANQLPDPASQSSANQSGSAGAMLSSDPDKTVPMGVMGTPSSSEMTSVKHDIPPAITTKTLGDEGAQDNSMELDSTSYCVPPTDAEVDTTGTNQDND